MDAVESEIILSCKRISADRIQKEIDRENKDKELVVELGQQLEDDATCNWVQVRFAHVYLETIVYFLFEKIKNPKQT